MSQKGAFIDTKSACIMILAFLPSGTGMNKFLLFINYLIDYCLQQKNTISKLPYLCGKLKTIKEINQERSFLLSLMT